MKVSVDVGTCFGAGQCLINAPGVFDQDADGIAIVLMTEPPAELHEQTREAADLCPARAISISED